MTRARFLKIVAAAGGGAAIAYVMYELAPWMDGESPAAKSRQVLRTDREGSPLMRELVRYATLAASGHNAQPWTFLVSENQVEIHPDFSRRLPAVDPGDRELWISLGCALENLTLAALKAGLEPEIDYPTNTNFINIRLRPRKAVENPLVEAIPTRQNTRNEYDGRSIVSTERNQLMSIPLEPGISLRQFDGTSETEKLLEYIAAGNHIQFSDRQFMEELVQWIRFDKREALATLDGLYSRCMGSPPVPRWLGKRVVQGTAAKTQSDLDAKMLRSSAGAVAIASDTDTKNAWVRTGQVYQRLALAMTAINVKSAFLNQPNEVPAIRHQFQDGMGFGSAIPQLLLRFGYSHPMPPSLRRSVDSVIEWS
jgi:hypothetical protein